MTRPEVEAIAGFLGLSIPDFGRRYLRRIGGSLSLTEKPNHDCIFWQNGCTVYSVRPTPEADVAPLRWKLCDTPFSVLS